VALSGTASGTTTANSSGGYSFTGLGNGSYAVTPSNSGYSFSPSSQAVGISGANMSGVNFTATAVAPTYSISGTISPASSGAGATVTLSGAGSFTTSADASGNFSFSALANGTYTLTPSSPTATFSPTSQTVTISNGNVTAVNFTATATANVLFFDDFTGTTLSPQWTALNRAGDYSNGELQCYQPANAQVVSGALVETFMAQSITCGDQTHAPSSWNYTSAMVQWSTFNFTYGTVEVRAKIPNTSLWPAIWMLGSQCQASNPNTADNVGTCQWFASGSDEIDIAEFAPNDATARENSYSNGDQNGGGSKFSCGSGPRIGGDGNFHVFTFTWTATSLSWAVDGVRNCTTTTSVYIPTKPMFLILNIAANNSAGPSGLPQTMQVDYVKVTQP
jgi:beta-glucanase (GH16 family)